MKAAAVFSKGTVLDVGCGTRPYEGMFRGRGCAYLGLEHPRSGNHPERADVHGDGLCLPVRTSSCGTVVSFQVLEHVPEPARLVAEMARALSPGGHLILTAPHIWGLHEEPEDYFRFTRYGLHHLCTSAGLEVVYVEPMAGYWVTAAQRFCYYVESLQNVRGLWRLRRVFPVIWFITQLAGLHLDRLHRVETDTWNYVLVARKPLGPVSR